MRILILLFILSNVYGEDLSLNSCFNLFKMSSNLSRTFERFPYRYSKVLKYKSKSSKIRKIRNIQDLKLGTYNLENFAATSFRLNNEQITEKTKNIMNAISNSNLDVVVLQEVLDIEYLKSSVKNLLKAKYEIMVIDRPDVFDKISFLVKKDLPFEFRLHSMNNYKFGERKVFNKDFPILEILHEEKPVMFYGGVHLKSRFGGRPSNNYFENIRDDQIKSILKIQQRVFKEYSTAPFFIGGDFNNNLLEQPKEFELLKKYMTDSFDSNQVPRRNRLTNISTYKGKRVVSQLDGIFYNKKSSNYVVVKDIKVFQYKSRKGYILDLSDSRTKRGELPSDHSLVTTIIDLRRLLRR